MPAILAHHCPQLIWQGMRFSVLKEILTLETFSGSARCNYACRWKRTKEKRQEERRKQYQQRAQQQAAEAAAGPPPGDASAAAEAPAAGRTANIFGSPISGLAGELAKAVVCKRKRLLSNV